MKLECYAVYDRRRKEFHNFRTGLFGLFEDATLHSDADDARYMIPSGEEWCVVMKISATAEMVTP